MTFLQPYVSMFLARIIDIKSPKCKRAGWLSCLRLSSTHWCHSWIHGWFLYGIHIYLYQITFAMNSLLLHLNISALTFLCQFGKRVVVIHIILWFYMFCVRITIPMCLESKKKLVIGGLLIFFLPFYCHF